MQQTMTLTRRRATAFLIAAIAVMLAVTAACGGDSQPSQPTTTAAPSSATAAISTAAPMPTTAVLATATPVQAGATASATVAPSSPSASSSPAAAPTQVPAPAPTSTRVLATATAGASVPAGGAGIAISTGTKARYLVKEQLAGRSLPNDAIGETPDVSGAIIFGPDGAVQPGSSITVKTTTLKSDESRRDNYLRTNSLETARYPEVKIVPTGVEGLPWPLPVSGQVNFKLTGDLTVHGQTKPVTWEVTALLDADKATGTAKTRFKFGDFGMGVPRVFVVLSVEDDIRLELDFIVTIVRG